MVSLADWGCVVTVAVGIFALIGLIRVIVVTRAILRGIVRFARGASRTIKREIRRANRERDRDLDDEDEDETPRRKRAKRERVSEETEVSAN